MAHHPHEGGGAGPGIIGIGHAVLQQPHHAGLHVAQCLAQGLRDERQPLVGRRGNVTGHETQPRLRAAPTLRTQLAAHQIERLNAVGAFIDHGDAGIAHELIHAPFGDIAVAAQHLLAIGGDLVTAIGAIALDDGREQADQIVGHLALGGVGGLARQIKPDGAPQHQRAHAFGIAARVHQHAAHIGVDDDRIGLAFGVLRPRQAAALQAALGVLNRVLIRRISLRQALDAHAQPRGVHHDEHGSEALHLLAQHITGGAIIIHHAGGVGVDAHLVFDGTASDGVARTQRTIVVHDILRHDEQADALHAVRRARRLGQHEVDDVVRQVMLAGRNEDLGAGDRPAAIGVRLGAGADQAEIGAALRLGQVHGASPAALHHVGQPLGLLLRRTHHFDRRLRAFGQAGIHAECHVGRRDKLLHHRADRVGQALAAMMFVRNQPAPAAVAELLVGLPKPIRRRHAAVSVAGAALAVTGQVERCQNFGTELAALVEHGLDQIGRDALKTRHMGLVVEAGHGLQHEQRVFHRGAIGGHGIRLSSIVRRCRKIVAARRWWRRYRRAVLPAEQPARGIFPA